MEYKVIHLKVNGREHHVALPPNTTLLNVLRDHLNYMDVKNGCEKGDCGACTVLFNGKPINSCLMLAWQADGGDILTVAGLGSMENAHPIQKAFADEAAAQCGFCTPGMVLVVKALLDENPNPTEEQIREALSGNLCRCTGYSQIVHAVQLAADIINQQERAQ
jgi:carbon-monoxide dehydrogenase small subunit